MKKYVLDIETVSGCDLPKKGAKVYANDPSTFISMISWSELGTEAAEILVRPEMDCTIRSKRVLEKFQDLLNQKEVTLICHNYGFEKALLTHCGDEFIASLGLKGSFNSIKIKYLDTKELSLPLMGPGSLEDACEYFGLAGKDRLGAAVMKETTKLPKDNKRKVKKIKDVNLAAHLCHMTRNGKEVAFWGGPDIIAAMTEYCMKDVLVTERLYKKLMDITNKQSYEYKKLTEMSIAITRSCNERGIKVDTERLNLMCGLIEEFLFMSEQFAREEMGIDRLTLAKTRWAPVVREKGYWLPNFQEATIKESFIRNVGHEDIKEILRKYQIYNKASLRRILGIRERVYKGRLYDFLSANAAITGRWTSPGASLQNLPRPHSTLKTLEDVDKFLKECKKNPKILLDGDNADKLVGCARTLFVPSEGKKFFVSDLSQIEYRIASWHAGYIENIEKLESGVDVYKELAAKLFKVPVDKVTPDMRSCGKEGALSLQYGVGHKRYQQACKDNYGIELTKKEAKRIVNDYRELNDTLMKLHKDEDLTIQQCVIYKKPYKLDLTSKRSIDYNVPWQYTSYVEMTKEELIDMKAGRLEDWKQPEKRNGVWVYAKTEFKFSNGHRKYSSLYGAIGFQNRVQAEARDILLYKMMDMHKKGHKLALTVHDEVIYEFDGDEEKIKKDWEEAGKKALEHYFPKLKVSSDYGVLERYYKI